MIKRRGYILTAAFVRKNNFRICTRLGLVVSNKNFSDKKMCRENAVKRVYEPRGVGSFRKINS